MDLLHETEKKYKVSKLIDGLTRLQMNDTVWLTVIPAKYSDIHTLLQIRNKLLLNE